ncbi:sulfurtransferase [Aureisphaera galaxeae]|uniref:sulfurtransferase n=1 Tax=Aureisphaera galaxeae TaxID=1538023 RepID=UPI0023500AA3|nr:sulfurtransferase [Aureisphaera galaxeae]MDC8005830.1 sulfurtransferase [Aureisphaera galaxeae]
MNWKSSPLVFICLLFFCCNEKAEVKDEPTTSQVENSYYRTDHIIEAQELVSTLDRPHIKIIDFRKEQGYNDGHIDGAINIWRKDMEDTSYPYSGMMASEKSIEALFQKLGIKNNDTLVAYDDRGSCEAARFWWVLGNYGFKNVKILNGGLDAWKEIGGAISTQPTVLETSSFTFKNEKSNTLFINKDSLRYVRATQDQLIVLDTRTENEFSGKRQKKGATKAGRIPGSVLIDWVEAVDFDNNGKLKSLEELKGIYAALGTDKNRPIVVYCHSGVRSAHTTFVLTELLGYKNVRNYDGSWTEWSHMEHFPVETDSTTTLFQ